MIECDVIVIGAGMAGASAAYHLARSARVVLLERETQPGYHTTGRSAAVFSEIYGNATIRALTTGSRPFFAAPPAGFAEHALWSKRAAVMVGRANQEEALDRLYAETSRLAPTVRRLHAAETRALLPMLKPDYVGGAVLEPDSSDLDVNALHQGFLRGAQKAGTRLICNADVRGLRREGSMWHVQTQEANVRAPVLVNAGGAWGDAIASLAGARAVGLVPKRRTAILFDPTPAMDVNAWPTVIDVDEQFYFKPDAGRLLGSPADETPSPPCDAQPEEIDIAVAVDRIEQAALFSIRRIARKWAGLRSFVADKTPVVGFDPVLAGFFWLIGQGGYGIQTAPAMGRVADALVRGQPIPDDLAAIGVKASDLSPSRFPGNP